jgi:hypothetical protein
MQRKFCAQTRVCIDAEDIVFSVADEREGILDEKVSSLAADLVQHSALAAPPGISRQQLINRYSSCAAKRKSPHP